MQVRGRRVLLCDCEGSMPLDGKAVAAALAADPPVMHTQLCRRQLEAYRSALAGGEPLLVACTQEAPLFDELARDSDSAADVAFTNIRERAGWSEQARRATPKIAALLAEAALALEPTPAVTLASNGSVLVMGSGEAAFAAARQLRRRLAVTLVLTDAPDLPPPPVRDMPIYQGTIRRASGHLGAFRIVVDRLAAATPSSRGALAFAGALDEVVLTADLILDLTGGTALFPAPARRDGYVRVEPSDAARLQQALFDLADMVGTFEKPRYLRIDPQLCAHRRNGIVACELCLGVCPTGALSPSGDHTVVDLLICDGAGACASVCPTGAIVFDVPAGDGLLRRLATVAATYRLAGGRDLVLLVHDPRWGEEMIATLAHAGPGLPAHVVPFAVHEVTQIGLDFLLSAFAQGVAQVRILAAPGDPAELRTLEAHRDLIALIFAGLGWPGERVRIEAAPDPAALARDLYAAPPPAAVPPAAAAAPEVTGATGKRPVVAAALAHLHAQAPAPVAEIALPAGAPFGQVLLDGERCTLCLACVGVCPTRALGCAPERPLLSFVEQACVQCGLCRKTCPENAITLAPRLAFSDAAARPLVLKEDQPFACIRCGKPFGNAALIERLTTRMAGHSMFARPGGTDVLKMCEDCRVVAHFTDDRTPLAGTPRPAPRTTEDYLRERAQRRDKGTD